MSGLVKAKKFDIADSNIALLGSDLEKNVRLNAAQTEKHYLEVDRSGLEIWRIEKFQVVAWPKDHYGQFFSGDSYIILRTYKKKPEDKKFSYDVHFWLGKETSQDEAGTAAYKTVELDDFLGGIPVQHREVQGHESELFLSYFPKFHVMEGGVESGFKHVKPEEYRHRLLQIKGNKSRVVVREVPKTFQSLNSGDVFILDCGLNIYQFNGKDSNGLERHKAAELSRAIDDERKGLSKIIVFNEGDNDLDDFWAALGDKGVIASAETGENDKKVSNSFLKKLLRLSDAKGLITIKETATGKVSKNDFDTNDVFIFDSGFEIFVWVGAKATIQERRMCLQYAQDYLVKNERPAYLPISRILEGGENEVFDNALDSESSVLKSIGKATKDVAPVPGLQ